MHEIIANPFPGYRLVTIYVCKPCLGYIVATILRTLSHTLADVNIGCDLSATPEKKNFLSMTNTEGYEQFCRKKVFFHFKVEYKQAKDTWFLKRIKIKQKNTFILLCLTYEHLPKAIPFPMYYPISHSSFESNYPERKFVGMY